MSDFTFASTLINHCLNWDEFSYSIAFWLSHVGNASSHNKDQCLFHDMVSLPPV